MSEIIGVLIAALVAMFGIHTYTNFQETSNQAVMAATTASEWAQVNAAATSYIQQNATAIQGTATATTPAVITVAMLQSPIVNLLPASFNPLNPYQQTWQVEVLQPTAGNLQALVITTGGQVLLDKQAGAVAQLIGASGGVIPKNDSGLYPTAGMAYGTAGSWKVPTTGYTGVSVGELSALLTFNNGQLQSPYVYRAAVPGQPQLNAMSTPLVMDSQQTAGSACTAAQNGAIAMDNSQGPNQSQTILTCNGTLWQANGCIATGADLNTIESGAHCYNGVGNANSPAGGDWFFMQESRHINMANQYAMQRVVGMTGASVGKVWMRSEQNSTWSAWNQEADPNVAIWDQPTEGGVMQLTGANGVVMYVENTNGVFRLVNSAWTAQLFSVDQSGNLAAAGTIQPGTAGGTANPGWACSPTGAVAQNANGSGQTLSCQSGVWSKTGQPTIAGYQVGNASGNDCNPALITAALPPGATYHAVFSAWGYADHGASVDFDMYINGAFTSNANAVPGQTVVNARGWSDIVPANGLVSVQISPTGACGTISLRADFIVFS